MKNKFSIAISLALIAAILVTSLALADTFTNDVVAGGNDTITVGGSTTITYKVNATADTQAGCNVNDGTPANVTISVPAGVTASTTTLTFTQCGVAGQKTVTYSSNTSGDYAITTSISDSGPGTYINNADFTLHVLAPPPPSDTTPPTITPNVAGTLGNNGWYVSDVTVSWSVVDNESSISSSSGCGSTTINADTAGTTLTCSATSAGGTSSQSVTIKRDATLPTLNPSVSPNPVALNGSATASPNASDATSDVASSSCDAVDTSTVGSHSVTCYAEDNAGNTNTASASFSVVYNFGGFFQPVDNLPAMNAAKAGQAIPLKWRLTDANGAPVLTLTSVTVTVTSLSCSLGTTIDQIEEYAAGSSGLQNLGDGYYQFNWKTPTSYANSCKTMNLSLGDGVPHTAQFQFKK